MKKYILSFALIFSLILSGCSGDKTTAGSKSPEGHPKITVDSSTGQITENGPDIDAEKILNPMRLSQLIMHLILNTVFTTIAV